MWLTIKLKVTKSQGFNLSVEDIFLENQKEGGEQIEPFSLLGLSEANLL